MFAHSGSSPKPSEPVRKTLKAKMQTSLDSYSRPGMRLAKRAVQAKGAREEVQGMHRTLKSSKEAGLSGMAHIKEKEKEKERERGREMARQKAKEPQRGLRDPGSIRHEGSEESEDNELDNDQEQHSEEDRDGPSVGRTSK